MFIKVSRTSLWEGPRPCEEAFKARGNILDVRTCSEEEFDKKFSKSDGKWRDHGTDHCVLPNGYIQRKVGEDLFWHVEINSLQDLIEFYEKYGKIIINDDGIEIYDTYRE